MAAETPRQTCLFFGTFNPIHVGHLMMAQSVFNQFAEELNLAGITFIPAADPPHRQGQNDMAPGRQRLKMVQLATASNPVFRVSDIEFSREGPSYTAETIRTLLQAGHRKPLSMIIGSDSAAQLTSWKEPEFLIEHLLFLQVVRPGQPFVTEIDLNGKTRVLNARKVAMPELEISATWIRQQIQAFPGNAMPLKYLVPEAVAAYITQNGLYQA